MPLTLVNVWQKNSIQGGQFGQFLVFICHKKDKPDNDN